MCTLPEEYLNSPIEQRRIFPKKQNTAKITNIFKSIDTRNLNPYFPLNMS